MKIVQIGAAYVGAQKTIERAIHNEWLSRGHDSVVLYAVGTSDAPGVQCYEGRLAAALRRGLRKAFGKNMRFARLSTKQLIRKLRQLRPDLVHLHVLHNGYLDYEMLFRFLSKQKLPVVYTAHDMWAFTGGCYYYTKEECSRFQDGCRRCPAAAERLDNPKKDTERHFLLKKTLFSSLEKVQFVAVSEWVAREMAKGFLADYPITVIDNGIDREVLRRDLPAKDSTGGVTLVAVSAAWDERKGIDRILDMARQLGSGYRFRLVGSATQELRDAAPENVTFLGYLGDKQDLLAEYAGADLHISASFEETFGMTFAEAAFMGTRSIGYAATAVTDTLRGVHGVVVEELTAQAMSEAIRDTVCKGSLKLSEEEIRDAVNRYSSDMMAKRYSDLCIAFANK